MTKTQRRRGLRPSAVVAGSLTLWALSGCGGGGTGGGSGPAASVPTAPETSLTEQGGARWVFCANEYTGCEFSGLRNVRYVVNGVATVKAFFGRLPNCAADQFGLPKGAGGAAKCEYASTYKTKVIPNPMPGMGGLGANVTVPLGHPGYADARVQATADRGVPASDGVGAFRVICELTHFAFDDPIAAPGKPGGAHLHMFFGNAGVNALSTAGTIANSGKSSCQGGVLNRTAYWTPAMIDGAGQVVLPLRQIFYYKTGYGGVKPGDVRAMPAGLRMIAGDKTLTSAQGQGHWGCGSLFIGHKDSIADVVNDPRCGPGKLLTLTVDFPQCWDGKNLDSPDHISHMANPGRRPDGTRGCPGTHPVAIPVISINVVFQIPAAGAAGWHLSSDMYDYKTKGGGYSAHADWWDGWDRATLNTWINHCNRAAQDCHAALLGDGRTLF